MRKTCLDRKVFNYHPSKKGDEHEWERVCRVEGNKWEKMGQL